MAQPLPQLADPIDYAAMTGIDASASRLEQALRRLESAASNLGLRYSSLKGDQEKLNRLLRESENQVSEMREAVAHVSKRLDHTITTMEALD